MQKKRARLRSGAARRYVSTVLLMCPMLCAQDYEQGVAFIEKGQFEAAIPLLTRAASAQNDARAHKALGVAYAALGNYDMAEPSFGKACALDSKLLDACYYHGRALYALNRFEASIEALRRAPASWRVTLGIAQALEALGRASEAEPEFRKALVSCRDTDPQPGVALGQFLIRQGRQAEAMAPLEVVVKRFPRAAEAHIHLGRVFLDRNETASAIEHLKLAVSIDPRSAQAHLLLAKAYVQSGRPDEAKPHFQEAATYAK